MKDERKTKALLIEELKAAREKISAFEAMPESRQSIKRRPAEIRDKAFTEKALEEREQFQSKLLENSPNPILVINSDSSIIYANRAFWQLTGFDREEVVGVKAPYPWWPKNLRNKIGKDLTRSMKDGARNFEEEFVKKNGERFWVEINSVPVFGEKGSYYYLANWVDITERKRIVNERILSESRFRTLAETSPAGIYETDKDGKCLYVNEQWRRMSGLTQEEAAGDGWIEGIHPEDRKLIFSKWKKMTESFGHWALEYRFMNRDKEVTWVSGVATPIFNDRGQITGYVGVNTDITAQKLAADAFHRIEEQLRLIADASIDAIWQLDATGNVIYMSQAVERILGYTVDEALKLNFTAFFVGSELERASAAFKKALSGEPSQLLEFNISRKDGSTLPVEISVMPMIKEDKVIGVQGIARDITERKGAEEALKETEKHYHQLFTAIGSCVAIYEPVDDDFVFVDINPAGEKHSFVKRDEIVGRKVTDVFPSVRDIGLFDVFQRVAKTGKTEYLPLRQYKDNRITEWVENTVYRLPNGQIVAVYEDTSEKQIAEQALRDSEKKYRLITENATDIVWTMKIDGFFDYISPSVEKITGFSPEEVLKMNFREFVTPESAILISNILSEQMAMPAKERVESIRFEAQQPVKDGSIIDIEVSATWIKNEVGEPIGVQGITRNISDKKMAERELRLSEEKFSKTFHTAPYATILAEYETRTILDANQSYEDICGYTAKDIIGIPGKWGFQFKDKRLIDRLHKEIGTTGKFVNVEAEINTKSGETKTALVSGSTIDYQDRKLVLCSAMDITERKRGEEALHSIEWLLKKDTLEESSSPEIPEYGDLSILNTQRTILDAVDRENLRDIAKDFLGLLETSSAIYEKNGDHVLRMFSSAWCSRLDQASRRLCSSDNNQQAMQSGCWLCHESCWTESSKPAIETNCHTDIECNGGIRLYAVPIHANKEVIGSICFSYGDPPKDPSRLQEIAERYKIEVNELERLAASYRSRPAFIIEQAKKRLTTSADIIGLIVERALAERKSKESEQRFRAIVEDQTEYIVRWKSDGIRTFVNQAYCDYFGQSREEMIGTSFLPLVAKEDRRMIEEKMERLRSGAPFETDEHRVIRPDGTIGWQQWTDRGIPDEQGRIVEFQSVGRDITDRKQAEEALLESTQFAQEVISSAQDGIIVYGPDLRYQVWNKHMEKLSGIMADDVLGRHPLEIFPFLRDTGVYRRIERALAGEYPGNVDFSQPSLTTGELLWVSDTCAPLRNAQGKIIGVIGIVRDISMRKKAEEALRERESMLRQAQHVASLGHYTFYPTGGTWVCSEALEKVFGIDATYRKTTAGWLEIVHPDHRSMMAAYLQDHVLGKRNSFDMEYRIRRIRDGAERWVRGLGDLKFGSNGEITEMFGTIQDVTDLKRAEVQRQELEEQLNHSLRLEAVGRLAGGVAHDFNNLLTAINGFSEMILDDLQPGDPLRPNVEEIYGAGERAAELTGQLLAFSRKQVISPRIVQPNEILNNSQKMLCRVIGEDIDFAFTPASDLGQILADPAQIDQVIMNLAVNARDAMPKGGKLAIETRNVTLEEEPVFLDGKATNISGNYVLITVADNGIGMDEETKKRIFEPFFSTKQKDRGTGLGMATVYGIVRQNEGFIDVISEADVGTTFKIFLPRVYKEADKLALGDKSELPKGNETILLAEDDDRVRRLTRNILEKQGYHVIEAEDGESAYLKCSEYEGEIHILLSDVIMPKMNGKELYDKLQKLRPDLKALFMSGYTETVIAHHGVLDEGVQFIQKPFRRFDLATKIRAALDG